MNDQDLCFAQTVTAEQEMLEDPESIAWAKKYDEETIKLMEKESKDGQIQQR